MRSAVFQHIRKLRNDTTILIVEPVFIFGQYSRNAHPAHFLYHDHIQHSVLQVRHGRSAEPTPVCDAVAYRGDEVIPLQHIVVHRNAQPVSHGLQKTFYNGNIICHLAAAQRQAAIFGNAVCNFRIQPNRTDCRRDPAVCRDQVNRHRRACDIIRKGKEILRRAEISHKIIAGAARNTCHLCVFIGIRPRKYLVQSTVPAAGVKAHRFPVITVLPGDFSRVAGVLCQLHSIIHTRTGRRVDQPRHKIKAGVRFPGYRIHNKNMLHQGIPLSSHFIIIIPHLYQTYNCHSVQKSGR